MGSSPSDNPPPASANLGAPQAQELIASCEDGIITQTLDGTITSWNRSAEELLGWHAAEMVGRPGLALTPPGVPDEMEGLIQSVRRGERLRHFQTQWRRQDGQTIDVSLSISPLHDASGKVTGAALLFRNITDQKRAERILRNAKESAESANVAKTQFLANMSHELRTPLNAIIGYGEMLEEDADDAADSKYLPDLRRILSAARHLLTLINTVLDLSKVEAGRMELYVEHFGISRLVRDVVETIRPTVEANKNKFITDCPTDIGNMTTDLTRLRQGLFNILGNAGKFTQNGTIQLSVTRSKSTEGDWISFVVTDSGIGITPEQMQRLFQPFVQADVSTSREFGGTGLGLAITRQFCRLMGGDIAAQSGGANKGSTFTIRLPANAPVRAIEPTPAPEAKKPAAPADPQKTDAAPERQLVLVIDDAADVRDLLNRFLPREGFAVALAATGAEAIKMAREKRPSIITLDISLPDIDGWELLKQLKADPQLAGVPVIPITMVDDRRHGMELGAAAYLVKPIDRARLAEALEPFKTDRSERPILVVEDDPDVRELIRRTIELDGWRVLEAADGREALRAVADRRPALILLDLMMPRMDGFEFVTELRKNDAWRSIPIMVITARQMTDADHQALDGAVYTVIKKSVWDREDILRRVAEMMAKGAGRV